MIFLRNMRDSSPAADFTFEELSDSLSNNWGAAMQIKSLAIPVILIAIAWMIYYRIKHPTDKTDPKVNAVNVFYQIANDLGISLKDQKLLFQIAIAGKLESPLTVISSPQTYDHYYQSYLKGLKSLKKATARSRGLHLKKFLYG